ncbi:hypothetical protein TsFJ059_003151 [Trichoderma semiorbis]|uniref:GH18 domain-containing protein n=1 Tax=Trichoderma semiorbis TaxID=1491008 RepID=A0A9P8HKX2_9HYPO|nr:hypothetical protein TsFJ059_003151 [Trichoderma semiorbis]
MSEVLDYIVYMTYDLHGQWDYNSTFANPGCPTGNCLRSHVNLTETEYALSMITKAGVPTNKIVVGVAGYGRSFGMVNPRCTGPQCLFTGPDSTATPGLCTNTAGYISQAELEELGGSGLAKRASIISWHDDNSDSDIMTYGNGTWVAYMSQDTKASRINRYARLNFADSVEWAIDLVQFVESPEDVENSQNVTAMEESFIAALALSNYDVSEFENYNLTLLATTLIGFDGCDEDKGFDPAIIRSGWQQSWKIMNLRNKEARAGINWNEASAVEYLGPPSKNKDYQRAITGIFKNLATIQPGWFGSLFSKKIAVRCDDPREECTCSNGHERLAYTTNMDAKNGVASINFCPNYFYQHTLDQLITLNANLRLPAEIYADMNNYDSNQGSTWIHELLHIDWVAKAGKYGTDQHISDLTLKFNYGEDDEGNKRYKYFDAYGPALAKALARFAPRYDPITYLPVGTYTIRNADNLSLYALARYV